MCSLCSVQSARVVCDAYGASMNYGFVQMATVEQAEEVVQALGGCDLFGTLPYVARTYLRVSQARSRQQIYGAKRNPTDAH